jgi:hypothetical protein
LLGLGGRERLSYYNQSEGLLVGLSKRELLELAILRHTQHMWVTSMAVVVGTPTLLVAIEEMDVSFEVALIWGAAVYLALREARVLRKEIECARADLLTN